MIKKANLPLRMILEVLPTEFLWGGGGTIGRDTACLYIG